MSKDTMSGGWQATEIKDSFIMCPIDSLPEPIQTEAHSSIGEYQLIFGQTIEKRRPKDVYVLLPDFLSDQPLHIFTTVVTNFNENTVSLAQAIEHDRKLAQIELNNIVSDPETQKSLKVFLGNLDFIANVTNNGIETDILPEDIQGFLPPTLLKDGKPTGGVKYFSYTHEGFRPVY